MISENRKSIINPDNTKELFLKVMQFQSCERTLNWEFGYWGGALKRWYNEGLPRIKGISEEVSTGRGVAGPGQPSGLIAGISGKNSIIDFDVSNYFQFDENFTLAPYNYWIFPRFDKQIISEDERYIELCDTDGIRKKILKDDSSMPFWLDWPVKNRNEWEKVKEERFNFDSINKRYVGDLKSFIEKTNSRTFPLGILGAPVGFFGTLRFLFGEQKLFMLYYDDPGLINSILDYFCEFWLLMIEELTSKMEFDVACFWEDMSGKQGSLISPSTFRQFMTPRYKRIIDFLKTKGIKLFMVDTDGKVNELIPLFLEAGVNIMYPFEQQAGNDLIEIRKKFPNLRMLGGFNKNVIYEGKKAIDKELEKMSFLISKGGYIPCADHNIPPNCSWENFKYYRKRLKEIIYSIKVLGN